MTWNPRCDAWLSGFAAGEGTFYIGRRAVQSGPRLGSVGYCPGFGIELRDDELPILEALLAAFDGKVRARPPQANAARPTAVWRVGSKGGLLDLVVYFERFPLRAKKARDFEVWARAVRAYAEGGYLDARLPALRAELDAMRVYRPAVQRDEPLASGRVWA